MRATKKEISSLSEGILTKENLKDRMAYWYGVPVVALKKRELLAMIVSLINENNDLRGFDRNRRNVI